MFVMSKTRACAVNLSHVESIGINEFNNKKYEVRAWVPSGDWYPLAVFKTKEEAERYIYQICLNYNDYWRRK